MEFHRSTYSLPSAEVVGQESGMPASDVEDDGNSAVAAVAAAVAVAPAVAVEAYFLVLDLVFQVGSSSSVVPGPESEPVEPLVPVLAGVGVALDAEHELGR